jgi:hypothetical protein
VSVVMQDSDSINYNHQVGLATTHSAGTRLQPWQGTGWVIIMFVIHCVKPELLDVASVSTCRYGGAADQ